MARKILTDGGYDLFVVASLLQKSLRRGEVVLAARAVNELFPRYVNYAWNRLMIVSAEDCADLVTQEIVALYDAWKKVNDRATPKDRGRLFLSKAIVILAKARHARDADELNILVSDRLPERQWAHALKQVEEVFTPPAEDFEIPEYVYDVHTRRGKANGMTKRMFIRDESDALENKSTIFDNLDEMIESRGYVAPEGRLF